MVRFTTTIPYQSVMFLNRLNKYESYVNRFNKTHVICLKQNYTQSNMLRHTKETRNKKSYNRPRVCFTRLLDEILYQHDFSTLIIFSNFVLFSLNKIVLVKKYWSVDISKLVRMTRVLSGFITIRACLRRRETLFSGVYGGARGSSHVRWETICLCWIRYDRYNLPLGKRHL